MEWTLQVEILSYLSKEEKKKKRKKEKKKKITLVINCKLKDVILGCIQ